MKKVVKVRIAVAVDPTGDWNSAGWRSEAADYRTSAMGHALEPLLSGERHYWLEAELEVPEAETVAAQVVES